MYSPASQVFGIISAVSDHNALSPSVILFKGTPETSAVS